MCWLFPVASWRLLRSGPQRLVYSLQNGSSRFPSRQVPGDCGGQDPCRIGTGLQTAGHLYIPWNPYAEAAERFQRAKPVKPWQGIRLAVEYGPIAQQEKSFPTSNWVEPGRDFAMGNNSQNLNVWTPGIHDGKKRPVMVWLHGGGFPTVRWQNPLPMMGRT